MKNTLDWGPAGTLQEVASQVPTVVSCSSELAFSSQSFYNSFLRDPKLYSCTALLCHQNSQQSQCSCGNASMETWWHQDAPSSYQTGCRPRQQCPTRPKLGSLGEKSGRKQCTHRRDTDKRTQAHRHTYEQKALAIAIVGALCYERSCLLLLRRFD